MHHISIELTTEQYQYLKSAAEEQGQSIADYVLEHSLPPLSRDSTINEAVRHLEKFLTPRVEEVLQGKFVNKSVTNLFEEVLDIFGRKTRTILNKTSLPYELTPAAEADVKEIARYTMQKWGSNYAELLEGCFQHIAKASIISRPFSKRLPQVKSVKCEHHYAFYLLSAAGKPVIIAVLDEHTDMLSRLTSQLFK